LGDDVEMLAKTTEYFNQAQTGEITLIIEQTVFTETIFVLLSFYRVPREKISEILSNLFSYKGIYNDDIEALLVALELFAKSNFHIVDCLLIAKSKTTSLSILSFDRQLNNVLDQDTDS
jgi:predicted nucleic-acid-binding protein